MSAEAICQETSFEVFGRKIAAKRWGNGQGPRFFALHGWLDNANTFDRLAPLLPELDLVALDFSGHGYSDHRAAGEMYLPFTDIQDVLAVADELGWAEFGLLGHSMGASISSELSGLVPDRVSQVVLIDGMVATGGITLDERLQNSRESLLRTLDTQRSEGQGGPRTFDSQEAMAMRVTQATDQSLPAASSLVARGSKPVEGGFTWRTDPRIRFPTPLRHTREYLDVLLAGVTAPTLLVVAEQGDEWYRGEIEHSAGVHGNLTIERMPGPHHIHLEPAYVMQVAEYTRDFLQLGPLRHPSAEELEWDGGYKNR